jgi:hypothetical protein
MEPEFRQMGQETAGLSNPAVYYNDKFSLTMQTRNSGFTTFSHCVTMKTTGLRNFFLLISVRRIAQDFLAFFRFTEADAFSILSAYGLHTLGVDRLPNNRPNEQEEKGENLGTVGHFNRISEPPESRNAHSGRSLIAEDV